jgi:Methyltransferase domain
VRYTELRPVLFQYCNRDPLRADAPDQRNSDLSRLASRFVLGLRERGSLGLQPEDLIPCDALIDGDHSERAVLHDSELARSLVQPGGVIMWHDYGNPAVEVTPTLDRLSDFGWPIEHVENSWIAFCRIDI